MLQFNIPDSFNAISKLCADLNDNILNAFVFFGVEK